MKTTRTLDWMAWYSLSPDKTKILFLEQLFEFMSLFPFVLLMIVSLKWALKGGRMYLLVVLVLVFTILGPTLLSKSIDIIKNRLALLHEEYSSFRLIDDNGWVHATIEFTFNSQGL